MKFACAIVLACLVANSFALLSDEPPNDGCIDENHSIGWQTDTIFCIGIPLNVDGTYVYAVGKQWVGRVTKNVAKPYTICCDSAQPKPYDEPKSSTTTTPKPTTKKPWWHL